MFNITYSDEVGASAYFCHLFDLSRHTCRSLPLLIVHGEKNEDRSELEMEAMRYSNISLCQARLDLPYGTHHTYAV